MNAEVELDLVDRAKVGDRAAFSALVDRYWLPLCRWLTGMTGKVDVAEDLTQETFVRAWTALPLLKNAEVFRVWLFRIARNVMLLRQTGSQNAQNATAAALADLDEDPAEPGGGPVNHAMEHEAFAALVAAIQRLPERYRAVYMLWSQKNIPYVEIAAILSITEENVRWRIHEARRMLVKELHAYLETPSS